MPYDKGHTARHPADESLDRGHSRQVLEFLLGCTVRPPVGATKQ